MQTQEQIPFVELKIARFPRVCQTISERILTNVVWLCNKTVLRLTQGLRRGRGWGRGFIAPLPPPPDFSYNVVFGLIKYFIQAEIYTTRTYTKTYSPHFQTCWVAPVQSRHGYSSRTKWRVILYRKRQICAHELNKRAAGIVQKILFE